jgi:hypothetical protein
MAQQTAVDWLVNQICTTDMYNTIFKKEIEQAKQMEKQQRIKDYNVGYTDAQCNHINDAENYANEQEYLNDNKTNEL